MATADRAEEAEDLRTKKLNRAPCVYSAWNDLKHKDTDFYPAVNCDYHCDTCGWNPVVAERRLEKLKLSLQKEAKHGADNHSV